MQVQLEELKNAAVRLMFYSDAGTRSASGG